MKVEAPKKRVKPKVGAKAQSAPAPTDDRNRREGVLRAAARLFRDQGFDGTTIRQIAGASNMQSGSPFYHFKDKQEILATVMEEGLSAGWARIEAVMERDLPLRDKFQALVRAHLETMHGTDSDFVPVLQHDFRRLEATRRRKLKALGDKYDRAWQEMVDDLHAAGLLKRGGRTARLWVMGAINYSAQWYRADHDRGLDLDGLARDFVGFFLEGGK